MINVGAALEIVWAPDRLMRESYCTTDYAFSSQLLFSLIATLLRPVCQSMTFLTISSLFEFWQDCRQEELDWGRYAVGSVGRPTLKVQQGRTVIGDVLLSCDTTVKFMEYY